MCAVAEVPFLTMFNKHISKNSSNSQAKVMLITAQSSVIPHVLFIYSCPNNTYLAVFLL